MHRIETVQPVSVSIGAKIASRRGQQIRELIEAGVYLNESDFVRDAIRHRLSEIKVIKCRNVDYETAKKEILGYYRSQEKHTQMRLLEILSLTSIL